MKTFKQLSEQVEPQFRIRTGEGHHGKPADHVMHGSRAIGVVSQPLKNTVYKDDSYHATHFPRGVQGKFNASGSDKFKTHAEAVNWLKEKHTSWLKTTRSKYKIDESFDFRKGDFDTAKDHPAHFRAPGNGQGHHFVKHEGKMFASTGKTGRAMAFPYLRRWEYSHRDDKEKLEHRMWMDEDGKAHND